MKKVLIGALALSSVFSVSVAVAGQAEDISARLDAIEKENALIRRENTALLQNRSLRERNDALKSSTAQPKTVIQPVSVAQSVSAAVAQPAPVVEAAPAPVVAAKPKSTWDKLENFFNANAADLPVKALPVATPGVLMFWGEGGAIWTGGDKVLQDYNILDFSSLAGLIAGRQGQFDLTPQIGWEVATGFDYKFAHNSPWHVSGQFRYGEGGRTSGLASTSGSWTLASQLPGIPLGAFGATTVTGSDVFSANYRETHWLADMAVGYEIAFAGPATASARAPASLQIKGGFRVAEFESKFNSSDNVNVAIVLPGAGIPPLGNTFTVNSLTTNATRTTFLGAGPLIGIDGSIPFYGNWSFDYKSDAAILFGTQQSTSTDQTRLSATPALLNLLVGFGNNINTNTAERFGYVLSTDFQAGFGYWVTPNIKIAASYRIDAMINVQNQRNAVVNNLTPDRYWHGPRLSVAGTF